MGSALLKLREQSRLFSNTEREIADHILNNPQMVVDMSIHELAKHTFSSASSIVRLCNHTGYSGYKEFRKAVTYELALREQNKRIEQEEIAHSDSLQDIIDKIFKALPEKDKLLNKLIEMYNEPMESLFAEPDEGNAVSWKATF